MDFVAGRKRVPSPATGKIALEILFFIICLSLLQTAGWALARNMSENHLSITLHAAKTAFLDG
jgi:hypothetical protein